MKQKNVILMVVAVGCGLAAAVLTSQMSGRTPQTETVEVIVASKDLPVGTFLSKEELKTAIKRKKMPKDALPPAFVNDEGDLIERKLARGIRAEETFNPKDLMKGGNVTLPPGMHMISLQIGVSQAVAGFVGPGARVDVLATCRFEKVLAAFPLLVNMLVIAVDTNTGYEDGKGVFPNMSTVSFAVDRRQALLLSLAKTRGCTLELMLRNQTMADEGKYDIGQVEKLLQMGGESGQVFNADEEKNGTQAKTPGKSGTKDPAGPKGTDPQPEAVEPPPAAPKGQLVKLPVATETIPPGTPLTPDLIDEKFVEKEFSKGDAVEPALSLDDLKKLAADNKALKLGLGKGQFVTGEVIGEPGLKPTQKAVFDPKDLPQPAAPAAPVVPAKERRQHEVTLHTPGGSRTYVYEEVKPGEWRLVGEKNTGGNHPEGGNLAPKGDALDPTQNKPS